VRVRGRYPPLSLTHCVGLPLYVIPPPPLPVSLSLVPTTSTSILGI
jgi:hypothetical protein